MTIEADVLMAYVDGELDPLAARRVETAIEGDPALAIEVERHRALRRRLQASFATVADEPVPDRLSGLLRSNVVQLTPKPRISGIGRLWTASAMAACLALGIALGGPVFRNATVTDRAGSLYAAGGLADALDQQASGEGGDVRIAVTFLDGQGAYCRVYASSSTDGIACRNRQGWQLRQTRGGTLQPATEAYRQAGSGDAELMAAAQDMMIGTPLDAHAEQVARDAGWRRR